MLKWSGEILKYMVDLSRWCLFAKVLRHFQTSDPVSLTASSHHPLSTDWVVGAHDTPPRTACSVHTGYKTPTDPHLSVEGKHGMLYLTGDVCLISVGGFSRANRFG